MQRTQTMLAYIPYEDSGTESTHHNSSGGEDDANNDTANIENYDENNTNIGIIDGLSQINRISKKMNSLTIRTSHRELEWIWGR